MKGGHAVSRAAKRHTSWILPLLVLPILSGCATSPRARRTSPTKPRLSSGLSALYQRSVFPELRSRGRQVDHWVRLEAGR